MFFYRTVISGLLLCCYSIGFAHGLIPHCQDNAGGGELKTEHSENHHRHDRHVHTENDNEVHFIHQGHCDDGMLDLLICMMDETEHPCSDNSTPYYTPAKTSDDPCDKPDHAKMAALLFAVFSEWNVDGSNVEFGPETALVYLSPPLIDPPYRGPPTIIS